MDRVPHAPPGGGDAHPPTPRVRQSSAARARTRRSDASRWSRSIAMRCSSDWGSWSSSSSTAGHRSIVKEDSVETEASDPDPRRAEDAAAGRYTRRALLRGAVAGGVAIAAPSLFAASGSARAVSTPQARREAACGHGGRRRDRDARSECRRAEHRFGSRVEPVRPPRPRPAGSSRSRWTSLNRWSRTRTPRSGRSGCARVWCGMTARRSVRTTSCTRCDAWAHRRAHCSGRTSLR